MKMDMFIPMVCGGTRDDVTEANWTDIMTDYLTLSGSRQAIRAVHIERQVNKLNNEIYLQSQLLNLYLSTGNAELLGRLKTAGYRYSYSASTLESDVNSILTALKHKEARVGQLKHELSQLNTGGQAPTEQDFYKQLDAMAEWQKVPVLAPEQLTVRQYCTKLVRFTEYIEAHNRANGSR